MVGQITTIHSFINSTGGHSTSSLYYDGTYLYGMTYGGGTNEIGTVFKVKPDGTNYDTLLNFNYTNGA